MQHASIVFGHVSEKKEKRVWGVVNKVMMMLKLDLTCTRRRIPRVKRMSEKASNLHVFDGFLFGVKVKTSDACVLH